MKNVFSFLLIFLVSCFANNTPKRANSWNYKYILKLSRIDKLHGEINHHWLLEKYKGHEKEISLIDLSSIKLNITPLISPRYSDEYLFCCVKENVDFIYSKDSKQLVDSLGKQYSLKYEKYYGKSYETSKLKRKGELQLEIDTLGYKYKIDFFKVNATFCKCRAAVNNLGSDYTDTIANINTIISYNSFTIKEKDLFASNLNVFLLNKIIQEGFLSTKQIGE